MSKHTDKRPFECLICAKCFKTQTCLTKHMMCHSEEKPYACKICDQTFKEHSSPYLTLGLKLNLKNIGAYQHIAQDVS